MRVLLLCATALFAGAVVVAQPKLAVSDIGITSASNPPNLSSFGFFDGTADRPVRGLIPYQLNTPLFSDYSEKQRFIYLPAGSKISAGPDGRLIFPIGTALIKSFGYPAADGKLQVIETRLLLHRAEGWAALPYVWRKDGSDADLRVGGTRLPVSFDKRGGEHLKDLLVGQILWVSFSQLIPAAVLSVLLLSFMIWRKGQLAGLWFYGLFALAITASVQLVGVYLVFASLIIPALATAGMNGKSRLIAAYTIGAAGYASGLVLSALLDLPSGALIVWTLAACALLAKTIPAVRAGKIEKLAHTVRAAEADI